MQNNATPNNIKYSYHNIPVPGGGFVTGFVFHPSVPNILYCRTDIGGIYRYDFPDNRWISLIDHAADPGMWETYPLSIALDKHNPEFVYAMTGDNITNKIAFSKDFGAHWTYFDVPYRDSFCNPVRIDGNAPGRSTGERLAVDPNDADILYMATMRDGLWKTSDRCRSWTRLDVSYPGREPETCFTFVETVPTGGDGKNASKVIIAATNGRHGSPDGNTRGQSVYISSDAGATFKPLKGEPAPVISGNRDHPGYVAQRAAFSGDYLFITYSAYNTGLSDWLSCGCDLGLCYDGALMRYRLNKDGEVTEALDITPKCMTDYSKIRDGRRLGCGMGGVCADPQKPGTLICSTVNRKPDVIFHSADYGATWRPILCDLKIGKIEFDVPYMRPINNGNVSIIHWLSDLKINPFDRDMAFFNTGTGIFMTRNLSEAGSGRDVTWSSSCGGVEETVHLNVYSPPFGDVHVIDILGDLGGFVFTNLDKPADNTFANSSRDRWITSMNADYPDSNPLLLIATPRGNWTGQTKGGLIVSRDQGRNWEQLKNPAGLSKEIDEEINKFQSPNITSGWAAISADGETIVWAIGGKIKASCLAATNDFGNSWHKSAVYGLDGNPVGDDSIKVMADRINPDIFYGFGSNCGGARFYVSTDKGAIFNRIPAPTGFPDVTLSGIDSDMPYEIRVESGKEGIIFIALQEYGLWKISYDISTNSFTGSRISADGDMIKRVGFGKPIDGGSTKTIYCSGTVGGVYGFWRSPDGGARWQRINDDDHQYGDIRSVTGDPRIAGRVYIGTGTRGLIYGDPADLQQF